MKKLLVSLFTLVLLFTLVSCECDHVDEDGNKVCDKCNLVLEEKCTEHKDDNNDNVCDNCGEKLSEPHNHVFVNGECECGVKDPNYVAPHEHEFVNGECECGEKDPNYVKPSDSIKETINLMKEKNLGFIVIESEKIPVGVITDRDLLLVINR